MEGLNQYQQKNYEDLILDIHNLVGNESVKSYIIMKIEKLVKSFTDDDSILYTEYSIVLFDDKENGMLLESFHSEKVALAQYDYLMNKMKDNRANQGFRLELNSQMFRDKKAITGVKVIKDEKIE